ncbi:putative clathrin assembly protein At5g57200 [Aegilops tauschii subsp. strangulata]|uniref:putative clathrin assembly protein At5g57200 n=1 Tax=Aegilops tauschii subsp. strangulata TaxID=200361 RepID=UPI000989FEF8|nr:putative clathrin assembly protein At5g57200 [Aegilops tauschii subsp. strangulata]
MGSWRKAYGALKDSTRVGLAKVHSDFKDLDIAIVKATNHVECPPKERHVRKIFLATSVTRPRADVAYCIYALSRRLSKTKNWTVALKTLIVIHRLLREGDPTFKEEFLAHSHKRNLLHMARFKDDSSPLAWDCSAWVRTYTLFLEERLECFRNLKYDIETERLMRSPQHSAKAHSRTRTLPCLDLMEHLPSLQQLLFRLMGCQPEGLACSNYLIQYALALALEESFKIYCAINDGIINLVDMFFDMPRYDAIKALAIYKRASMQVENLADFYEFCKDLELARTFQFPTLRQPPPSFLAAMEEYIREAPRPTIRRVDSEERKLLTYSQEAPTEPEKPAEEEKEEPTKLEQEPVPDPTPEPEQQLLAMETTGDLLNLDEEVNPFVVDLDEHNALALAIVGPGDGSKASTCQDLFSGSTSGWELALVTAPSRYTSQPIETKLAGGFDIMLLDSLYEDGARRQQIASVTYNGSLGQANNPFETNDPFAMSNSFAPPSNAQLAMVTQQQQYFQAQQHQQQYYYQPQLQYYQPQLQQQQQYFQAQQHQHQHQYFQQHPQYCVHPTGTYNPFGDPFTDLVTLAAPSKQGNLSLL